MNEVLVCPFSSKPLEPLAQDELGAINKRIERGELFFQSGVPVSFLLKKAYISSNRLYVYAEVDGILLLKTSTSIVERNQVMNPMVRTTEAEIDNFYNNLGLSKDGNLLQNMLELPAESGLSSDELRKLFAKLNKQGQCLVTAASSEVDDLHNLVFGTNYQSHIHIDHNINRLRQINGKLEVNTQYVLCDVEIMPFQGQSLDAYFSFNTLEEGASKELQKVIYRCLRSVLKTEASSVFLVDQQEKNHLEGFYKSDILAARLKPWKKSSMPQFYFQKAGYLGGNVSSPFQAKGRLVVNSPKLS